MSITRDSFGHIVLSAAEELALRKLLGAEFDVNLPTWTAIIRQLAEWKQQAALSNELLAASHADGRTIKILQVAGAGGEWKVK